MDEKALIIELRERGMNVKGQVPLRVLYKEKADIKRLVLNLPEGHDEFQPARSTG